MWRSRARLGLGAALRVSPSVTGAHLVGIRGPTSDWLPILLVVTGLVLAAALAALAAFRPLAFRPLALRPRRPFRRRRR